MLIKYVVCPYGLVGLFACHVLSATTCKCMLAPLCHYIYHNVELNPCVLLHLNISDIANVLIHSDLDISCTQTPSALINLVHSRSDMLCTKTSRALGHLVHSDHGTTCALGHLVHSDHRTTCALGHLVHSDHGTSCALGHLVHSDHGTSCALRHLVHSDLVQYTLTLRSSPRSSRFRRWGGGGGGAWASLHPPHHLLVSQVCAPTPCQKIPGSATGSRY